MRFYLDENIPAPTSQALSAVHIDHVFVSAYDRPELLGADDLDLFPVLASEAFDAIVTKDYNQTSDAGERRSLWDNQLVWIGHKMSSHAGTKGISLTIATVVAGLWFVLDDWPSEPWIFRLKGVQAEPGQRMTSTKLKNWS